jgi:hypothetical protein
MAGLSAKNLTYENFLIAFKHSGYQDNDREACCGNGVIYPQTKPLPENTGATKTFDCQPLVTGGKAFFEESKVQSFMQGGLGQLCWHCLAGTCASIPRSDSNSM